MPISISASGMTLIGFLIIYLPRLAGLIQFVPAAVVTSCGWKWPAYEPNDLGEVLLKPHKLTKIDRAAILFFYLDEKLICEVK